ncbi:MAG: M48 family metallopeptidase [Ignavibacteria bacterium]|nr:M48 family metallopeptidase [Ignavibacteria bacterium]MBT8381358.1 M48 family metallopeptidase [Ignavibacteria bacterium]MBT8392363.1 M48 family metallopeptidase [Ignavibacteria bacterium]NNJ53115.1 M48 family metallopeptidase [Ignavibacteriaceae bacterium]NNL22213.1 M48 family metallopeptidase [Ignavibacteriaceae bacterium]
MEAKRYNNIKLAVGIGEGIASFILLLLFVWLGYSLQLEKYLANYIYNSYLLFISFVLVIGIVGSIISFPISYYTGFYLEHKYDLSNQTIWKWIWENFKGLLVSLAIGIPILLLFYFSLNQFGDLWWLPFAIIMFLISVVLSQIFPILIFPIFYKITPIEDVELKDRITKLAQNANLKVENVYKFDMSKNTKKANAAFTGLGKTKRIILGDTLLDGYTTDEIETVIAHELGHFKKKHIIKNIVIGTLSSFLTLFLIALLYKNSLSWFGFESITQVRAIPLLALWSMIIGLLTTPLGNILSRKFEFEADEYAVFETRNPFAFKKTLEKLTDQNLGDKEPHPFVEWFFYSHPSIKNRINAIEKFSVENNLPFTTSSDLNLENAE